MNLHLPWPFSRPKPSDSHNHERRYYAATKAENRAAAQRRADMRLELDIAVVRLSPEQRTQFKDRASRRERG